MSDLEASVKAALEAIEKHRREILRLHPEVSDFRTVEALKRELLTMMEIYSDLLRRHLELLTDGRRDD